MPVAKIQIHRRRIWQSNIAAGEPSFDGLGHLFQKFTPIKWTKDSL
jgi:hypothetical protein